MNSGLIHGFRSLVDFSLVILIEHEGLLIGKNIYRIYNGIVHETIITVMTKNTFFLFFNLEIILLFLLLIIVY